MAVLACSACHNVKYADADNPCSMAPECGAALTGRPTVAIRKSLNASLGAWWRFSISPAEANTPFRLVG
jgi:hypothetical protein